MYYNNLCTILFTLTAITFLTTQINAISISGSLFNSTSNACLNATINDTCTLYCDANDPGAVIFNCYNAGTCNFHVTADRCMKNPGSNLYATNATNLNVYGEYGDSMKESNYYLPNYGNAYFQSTVLKGIRQSYIHEGIATQNIIIDCIGGGKDDCKQMEIYASNSQYLQIKVAALSLLDAAIIYCPSLSIQSVYNGPEIAPCIVDISAGGKIQGTKFFAPNGIPKDLWIKMGSGSFDTATKINCVGGDILDGNYEDSIGIIPGSTCWNTRNPTTEPTVNPTTDPTNHPTVNPTNTPTLTHQPTGTPTIGNPTKTPTEHPTLTPSLNPSLIPTGTPTNNPTQSTLPPTASPTVTTSAPTAIPSNNPTFSYNPTNDPTLTPTNNPSTNPSFNPTTTTIETLTTSISSETESTRSATETAGDVGNDSDAAKILGVDNVYIIIIAAGVVIFILLLAICLVYIYKTQQRKANLSESHLAKPMTPPAMQQNDLAQDVGAIFGQNPLHRVYSHSDAELEGQSITNNTRQIEIQNMNGNKSVAPDLQPMPPAPSSMVDPITTNGQSYDTVINMVQEMNDDVTIPPCIQLNDDAMSVQGQQEEDEEEQEEEEESDSYDMYTPYEQEHEEEEEEMDKENLWKMHLTTD